MPLFFIAYPLFIFIVFVCCQFTVAISCCLKTKSLPWPNET